MADAQFDTIECKNLLIKDKDGEPKIQLSVGDNGGQVFIEDKDGKGGGIALSFDVGIPTISILDRNGKLGITLAVDAHGGFIHVSGQDGKIKHMLFVENGRGKMLKGSDVLNHMHD